MKQVATLKQKVDTFFRNLVMAFVAVLTVAQASAQTAPSYEGAFTTIATTVAAIGAAAVVIAVAWVTARIVISGIKKFGH